MNVCFKNHYKIHKMKITGYSGTPLANKLGIKGGFKIRFVNPPKWFGSIYWREKLLLRDRSECGKYFIPIVFYMERRLQKGWQIRRSSIWFVLATAAITIAVATVYGTVLIPRMCWASTNFDVPGIKTAVEIDGKLNDNIDVDNGWSLEIVIPWKSL